VCRSHAQNEKEGPKIPTRTDIKINIPRITDGMMQLNIYHRDSLTQKETKQRRKKIIMFIYSCSLSIF